MKPTFAQTLLAWRKKEKLSRAEACRQFGIKYRTWQDWESGTHTPNPFVQKTVLDQLKDKGK